MTLINDRICIVTAIEEAIGSGARLKEVCKHVGLSARTYQRWVGHATGKDGRPDSVHIASNALSKAEQDLAIAVCNSPGYCNMSPNVIVPVLAEKGVYIASEASIYRILKRAGMLTHRLESRPTHPRKKPEELIAFGPDEVWSWDITYIKTEIRGLFYYLYLHLDIWSKMIMGWSVEEYEDGDIAAGIFAQTCLKHGARGVRLHSDNGSPMKSANMLSTLGWLGVIPSFSRPSVSNDNPFSESLFKTMKYRPGYPGSFKTIEEARAWVCGFVEWYNKEHRHSAIRYVTPEERHYGRETEILNNRKEVYQEAAKRSPNRFVNGCRDWNPIQTVTLNPKSHQDRLKACA